jgi:ABC-type glycerol-3-phosphate transport system substrate-binding protein
MLRRFLGRRQRPFTCTDVDDNVEQVRDGRLSARQTAAFKAHVASCNTCRQRLETESGWLSTLQATPAPARLTPNERRAMQQALGRQMRRRMMMRNIRLSVQQVAVLGVLALVVGAMVWWQTADNLANEDSNSETAVAENLAPLPADGSNETVITFAVRELEEAGYDELIAQFEDQNPGIHVQLVSLDPALNWATGHDWRQVAATADVILFADRPATVDLTVFRDLTPLLNSAPLDTIDYWPGIVNRCREGGYLYGWPLTATPGLIFYDTAAFSEANLPRPALDWTWTEMAQDVAQLTQREGDKVSRYGLAVNGGLLEESVAAQLLTTPASQVAAETEWFVTLARQGDIWTIDNTDEPDLDSLLRANQVAMWTEAADSLPGRRNTIGETITAVPYPHDAQYSQTSPHIVECAYISAGSHHPEAAWRWIAFLTTQAHPNNRFRIPARPSIAQASGTFEQLPADLQEPVRYALLHGQFTVSKTAFNQARQALKQVIVDGVDWQSSLTALARVEPEAIPTPDGTDIVITAPTATPSAERSIRFFAETFTYRGLSDVRILAQTFTEETGIAVDVTQEAKFNAAGFRGLTELSEQFDCFSSFGSVPIRLPELVLPLDPFLDQSEQNVMDQMAGITQGVYEIDGTQYGLPVSLTPPLIRLNETYFADQGVPLPESSWTFDEFVALATELAAPEAEPPVYGFLPYSGNALQFLLAGRGVVLYDMASSPRQAYLDHPDTVATVEWLVAMAEAGVIAPYQEVGAQTSMGNSLERFQWLEAGQVAMWDDLAIAGFANVLSGPQYRLTQRPLPPTPQQLPVTRIEVSGSFISRQASDPAACWAWINYLSENSQRYRSVPARQTEAVLGPWRDWTGAAKAAVYEAAVAQLAETAVSPSLSPQYSENSLMAYPLRAWFEDALAAAYEGSDAATVLATAQQYADLYLACIGEQQLLDKETIYHCARTADPEFRTPEELMRGS